MQRHLALILLLLLPAAAVAADTAACVADGPADTARWIYDNADEFYVYKKGSAKYVSPALLKLLQRDWKCQEPGEVCAIEAYPWTDTQDGSVLKPVSYRVSAEKPLSATVVMSFTFGWEDLPAQNKPMSIRIHLVRGDEAGCWQIDDITHGKDSFKQRLASWDYSVQ